MASSSSSGTCGICDEPLVIDSPDGDDGPSYIIDEVGLRCSHKFHWACLLDRALETNPDGTLLAACPTCSKAILDGEGNLIVSVRNEGGYTGDFDFGEEIVEEARERADPKHRLIHAFLSFMAFSDHAGAESLIMGEGVSVDSKYDAGGHTALHMCAVNDDVAGVKFLLEHGADPKIVDDEGLTPLDFAKKGDAQKVITLLS